MVAELIETVMEFKAEFLDKYPRVEQAQKVLSDFAYALRQAKPALAQQTETIDRVLELVSNSALSKYAEVGLKESALQSRLAEEYVQFGDHTGDTESINEGTTDTIQDAFGLIDDANSEVEEINELVDRLISDLE